MDSKKLLKIIDEALNAKCVDPCFQDFSSETVEFLSVCYKYPEERKPKMSSELVDKQLWAEEDPGDIANQYNNLFELVKAIRTHLVKEIREEENKVKARKV